MTIVARVDQDRDISLLCEGNSALRYSNFIQARLLFCVRLDFLAQRRILSWCEDCTRVVVSQESHLLAGCLIIPHLDQDIEMSKTVLISSRTAGFW